jgi:hypothetical protein
MDAERLFKGYVTREEWLQRNLDNAEALLNDMHAILLEHEKFSDVLNLRQGLVRRMPSKVYLSFRLDLKEKGEVWGIGYDALADAWFMQEENAEARLQGDREDLWDEFFHRCFLMHQNDHDGVSLAARLQKAEKSE